MTFTIILYWLKPNSDGTLSTFSDRVEVEAINENEAFGKAYNEIKRDGCYLQRYEVNKAGLKKISSKEIEGRRVEAYKRLLP